MYVGNPQSTYVCTTIVTDAHEHSTKIAGQQLNIYRVPAEVLQILPCGQLYKNFSVKCFHTEYSDNKYMHTVTICSL